MARIVTLVQGGGIGLDLVPAVERIVAAAGADVAWDRHVAGAEAVRQGRDPLGTDLLDAVARNGYALKTNLLPAPDQPRRNLNIELRRKLGLFAAVRPLQNLPGLPARFQGVDCYVLRELTEDLYASIEHEIVPGVVQSIKVVTETASRKFFRFAFTFARERRRKTVTCVHKANILKLADGLFLEAFRSVAKEFPEIAAKEIIVDNCCMQMASRPQQFDVLAMGNLYGDIVSDLGAGLVGGTSASAGINVGDAVRVYECFHAGNPEDFGADRANPLPLLLPAIDLLEDLGETGPAGKIRRSIAQVLGAGRTLPRDLGGAASTSEFAAAVVANLS